MSKENDGLEMDLDEEFGDLFAGSEVKVEPKQEPKPVAPAPAPAPAPKATKPVDSTPAAKPDADGYIPFGQKVSSLPIPRFKATKESKNRIAIMSKNVLAVKTHYVEGLGNIVCFDGKCCELEGMPRVRYILPVVQYEVNKAGTPISDTIEVKGLVLGSEQYDALASAVQFSGRGITDVDIIISCSDEQYQKITFAADASQGALWKTYPTAKAAAEFFKANRDKLYMAIARRVTPEVYLSHKGFVGNVPPTQPVGSLDDLGLDD